MRVLIVIALLVAGCSAPESACNPKTCSGCCDGFGNCLGGNTFADCGKGADICSTCALGQICSAGTCIPAPADAGCNLSSCGGCCDGAHVCHVGTQDQFCGGNANACADCTDAGTGYTCDMRVCIP